MAGQLSGAGERLMVLEIGYGKAGLTPSPLISGHCTMVLSKGSYLNTVFSGEKCLTSNVFCKGGSSVDLMCSPCPALGPDLWPRLHSERVLSLPEPGFAYSTACHQLR